MINIDIEQDYGLPIRTMVKLIDRLRKDGWSDIEIQQALDRYHSSDEKAAKAWDLGEGEQSDEEEEGGERSEE